MKEILHTIGIVDQWLYSIAFFGVLISLPCVFVRRIRMYAAIILLYCTYYGGFHIWLTCCAMCVHVAGWGVVTFGLFMGIIGIVPLTAIIMALHGVWDVFFLLIFYMVAVYGLRLLALWTAKKSEKEKEEDYYLALAIQAEEKADGSFQEV